MTKGSQAEKWDGSLGLLVQQELPWQAEFPTSSHGGSCGQQSHTASQACWLLTLETQPFPTLGLHCFISVPP